MQLGYRIRQRQSIFSVSIEPIGRCSSVISFYPTIYHPPPAQMMTFRSRILRPGKDEIVSARDVRRLETSDKKMNGSTFILPEKKKTTTTFLKEMRLSITCFFFISCPSPWQRDMIVQSILFYFDDIHSISFLFLFGPFFKWKVANDVVSYSKLIGCVGFHHGIQSSGGSSSRTQGALPRRKRLSYNTLDYIPQSLSISSSTTTKNHRSIRSFLSSRPILDKVRRFEFPPFFFLWKIIEFRCTSNVSSSQPVRYYNSSLRHQLDCWRARTLVGESHYHQRKIGEANRWNAAQPQKQQVRQLSRLNPIDCVAHLFSFYRRSH